MNSKQFLQFTIFASQVKSKIIILCLFFGLIAGCNNASYITVKHIKPANHKKPYNKKKDKRKKRVKYVKVKILKQSKPVNPPRATEKKEKEVTHEADSTGTL